VEVRVLSWAPRKVRCAPRQSERSTFPRRIGIRSTPLVAVCPRSPGPLFQPSVPLFVYTREGRWLGVCHAETESPDGICADHRQPACRWRRFLCGRTTCWQRRTGLPGQVGIRVPVVVIAGAEMWAVILGACRIACSSSHRFRQLATTCGRAGTSITARSTSGSSAHALASAGECGCTEWRWESSDRSSRRSARLRSVTTDPAFEPMRGRAKGNNARPHLAGGSH